VLAYRRGLDLARRELLETGDVSLDSAIARFSRKLGGALEHSGDVTGAEGVLREALDLTGPVSLERARLLTGLGRVGARRERRRDAARLLGQALEIATNVNNAAIAAEAQLGIAAVRHDVGDQIGAANALRRAYELLEEAKAPKTKRAAVAVQLGEVLVEVGDTEDATKWFQQGTLLAKEANAPALLAAATGALAAQDELAGNLQQAGQQYRDAARLAAEAGDATSHARWRRAAAALQQSAAAS